MGSNIKGLTVNNMLLSAGIYMIIEGKGYVYIPNAPNVYLIYSICSELIATINHLLRDRRMMQLKVGDFGFRDSI